MSQAIEYKYRPENLNESAPNKYTEADLTREEMIINIGPQHPSTHGVLRLEVVTDGEIVVDVVPHMGYLHRCFEKHTESVPFNQGLPFVDRMDYVAAMNSEHAFVMGAERMLGIENDIPKRVEYIRVLVAELNRIASHFVAIGTYGLDIGAFTPFLWVMRDREHILRMLEWISGARMLYNYIWVGGLFYDLPVGFEEKCIEFISYLKPKLKELDDVLINNKIFVERTANVGVLPRNLAISYGATGPVLRGSGLKYDLRRVDGYSVYPELDFDIPVGTGAMGQVGDCWDRTFVRVQEVKESVKIIEQSLEQLTKAHKRTKDFDPRAAVPKKIRPKAQDFYVRAENPKGELGFFFRTDGRSDIPVRCKARACSFSNLSVLADITRGHMIADLVAIIGSIDIVMGEVDR
ncbi:MULTISPECIES: NADH-quinone oxidoreductase subunit D [Reichenbachiella]|uniref:NADH-quinone oxidoreductase subunit D n=1 Tax=Reichenbachiella TaxID=156993 RepID=UPI000C158669|nr:MULTISPECIES: NADH-quinone oxidoreductase subunit D [Reichenbachiella]MBU2914568.1 NADH-quinone oxidoreductase subunit D [Reichenbachiella agariperforans]